MQMQEQIQKMQKQIEQYERETRKPEKVATVNYETDEEELARETEWIRVKNRKAKPTDPQQKTQSNPKTQKINSETKPKLPPPIIVDGIEDYNKLHEKLHNIIEGFQIKIINNNNIKINVKDGDSYRLVIHMLQEQKYSFHSYENKQNRPIKVMAKKLHHTCKPESIVGELRKRGYKILEATPKLKFRTKEPLNMFVLTFTQDENINKIYEITDIMGIRVEVVSLKKNRLVPQCKRCQAYGHTQKYCAKEARCVRCTGKHLTANCGKPKDDKPKCVHCGGEHPANYRGCTVAKEIQRLRQNQIKKPNLPKQIQRNVVPSIQPQHEVGPERKSYSYAVGNNISITKNKPQEQAAGPTIEVLLNQILDKLNKMDNRILNLEKRSQGAIPKNKNG